MSKELETLKTIKDMLIGNGVNDNINDYVDNLILPIKQALQRLEAIDSANPSEALKELNEIIEYITEDKKVKYKATILFDCEIIKQALLKAQEPKKYLKWEDLEFKAEEQIMEVTFNGSEHLLCYYRNMFGNLCIIDNTGITIRKENKDFFNDLHLERVEE